MSQAPWLLLVYSVPPKPDYARVKIWRELQKLGAVTLKNTVYALPNRRETQHAFAPVADAIACYGGDALVCEARFIDGISDADVRALFNEARDADYQVLADAAKRVHAATGRPVEHPGEDRIELNRLKKRLGVVRAIDFFDASGHREALRRIETALSALEGKATRRQRREKRADYVGRTWVTRTGVYIDRIASAWLIRRFIDPKARLRFVAADARRVTRELHFDMDRGEFTHEGKQCTFEVLLRRFGLADQTLRYIGEIIHDLDIEDDAFGRRETAGVARAVNAIATKHADDLARIDAGSTYFDGLYARLSRKAHRT